MTHSRTLAQTMLTLSEKQDAEKYIDAFLTYLTEKNLTGLLPQVLQHVKRLESQSSENDTLHIYSRYELTKQEIAEVAKIAQAVDAKVISHIDESVVGGFSATYNGRIYDGSLAHQITQLKSLLTR